MRILPTQVAVFKGHKTKHSTRSNMSNSKHYSGNEKAIMWMCTWYDYPSNWEEVLTEVVDSCNAVAVMGGMELCPDTGKEHIQGAIQWRVRTKIDSMKNLFKIHRNKPGHVRANWNEYFRSMHYDKVKHYKSWEEVKAYCSKEGNHFFSHGTFTWGASGQGKRTDMDMVRDAITSGAITNGAGLEAMAGLTWSALQFGDRLLRNKKPVNGNRRRAIFWLSGITGAEKSKLSREYAARLFALNGSELWEAFDFTLKWFDGYSGQQIALFDDFRPNKCRFESLLRITDRYCSRQEVKGGSTWFDPDVIIFTCCLPIDAAFKHLPADENINQLHRRIAESSGGEFDFNDLSAREAFMARLEIHLPVAPVPVPQPVVVDLTDEVEDVPAAHDISFSLLDNSFTNAFAWAVQEDQAQLDAAAAAESLAATQLVSSPRGEEESKEEPPEPLAAPVLTRSSRLLSPPGGQQLKRARALVIPESDIEDSSDDELRLLQPRKRLFAGRHLPGAFMDS